MARALRAAGIRPARVTTLGEGYTALAYRIEQRTGPLVLRLPKPPLPRSIGYFNVEVALYEALAQRDLGVAFPRSMRALRSSDGTLLATVHPFVEGVALQQAPRGRARIRLCEEIAAFLTALHATPIPIVRRAVPNTDLVETYRDLIEATLPHLGARTAAWLVAAFEGFQRGGGTTSAPSVLVHGDVQGAHLLLDGQGHLAVAIDFGNAMLADPAIDFAGVLNCLGWRDLEQVWSSYGGVIDADAERRVRFYFSVQAVYTVAYGEVGANLPERDAGVRRLTARAAAASRAASKTRA